jgi:hypothetical protein
VRELLLLLTQILPTPPSLSLPLPLPPPLPTPLRPPLPPPRPPHRRAALTNAHGTSSMLRTPNCAPAGAQRQSLAVAVVRVLAFVHTRLLRLAQTARRCRPGGSAPAALALWKRCAQCDSGNRPPLQPESTGCWPICNSRHIRQHSATEHTLMHSVEHTLMHSGRPSLPRHATPCPRLP